MAKKKTQTSKESAGPTIWDQIVESVNETNKDRILELLQNGLEFAESTGDAKTAKEVKETIKKIN